MEGEDFDRNPPLESTSDDRNPEKQRRQTSSYRSAASTVSSEVNLTSTSFSSLVSSSFSPPCFLKSVQAALKRHKPLGSMQSEALRARRAPLQQRQPSKPSDAPISVANNGTGRRQAAGSSTSYCFQEKSSTEDLPVNASSVSSQCGGKAIASSFSTVTPTSNISTPNVCTDGNHSFSVGENGLVDEVHVSGILVQQRQASKAMDAPFASIREQVAGGFPNTVFNQERSSRKDISLTAFSAPGTITTCLDVGTKAIPPSSCSVNPTLPSDVSSDRCLEKNFCFRNREVRTQCEGPVENERITLGATTLTEKGNFGEGNLPTKGESLKIPASHQPHVPKINMNFFAAHSNERMLGERNNLHPADPIPCSTMGSTCVTTMSLDSVPVPQSGCVASGARTTVPTQVSVSSSQGSSAGPQSVTCLDGLGTVEREADRSTGHAKAPQLDEGAGEKLVRGDSSSSLAPVPPIKSSSSNVDASSSKSSRGEKVPRKKKYDPDLFIKVNGKLYQKLGKIGTGGSSEVYKVIASDCTIYALKTIKLKGRDYPTAFGFCQEIEYLNKLKGRYNIIQLVDYEVTDKALFEEVLVGSMTMKDTRIKVDGYIYMVLEYGEIDLAHMLSQTLMDAESTRWNIKENWIRFYWQQMLQAVNTIHEERIVHSDLKPANFLLVKGSLKLIDFGIAKAILNDTTNIQRDSQVGTLNYMSPEAFMWNEQDASGSTIKCGRPSDIWSLGCILYQMVYGKTPFAEYKTFWSKFKVITDHNHVISYEPTASPWLIDLMKKCLAWNRDERWRIPQLLQHPFLNPPMLLWNEKTTPS